jgi:NTE family protein
MATKKLRRAIVLMGGGARAAYQIGVLKAVAELLPKGSPTPFQVVCGTSAGAINAVALATMADNYHNAVAQLLRVWGGFHVDQVFKVDVPTLTLTAARWMAAMMFGGLGRGNPVALLDRQPLRQLLLRRLDFSRIGPNIDSGFLHAVSVTASGYSSGQSVTFFQAHDDVEAWRRVRRSGSRCNIGVDHLMASSAIPLLFQAIKLNREYFGDGSMRLMAPLSSALHLEADRILVIGNQVDEREDRQREGSKEYPSLAQIAGHILDSIFLDSLEADLERLDRINKTIGLIPERKRIRGGVPLRRAEGYLIAPSVDIGELAQDYVTDLPRSLRFLLRGFGALRAHGTTLASYLLFEKAFCRALIRLGYQDTVRQRAMLEQFLAD